MLRRGLRRPTIPVFTNSFNSLLSLPNFANEQLLHLQVAHVVPYHEDDRGKVAPVLCGSSVVILLRHSEGLLMCVAGSRKAR